MAFVISGTRFVQGLPLPAAGAAPAPAPAAPQPGDETRNERAWARRPKGTPHAPRTPIPVDYERPWLAVTTAEDGARRAAIRDTLATGVLRRSTSTAVSGGVNGRLDVRTIVNPASGHEVRAVLKPISGGAAQELFAYEVARAIHADHLTPAVARRRGGTAAIEFRPGQTFASAGIDDAGSIERALRHGHRIQSPDLPAATIARQARIDRELAQALDVVLANGDRHGQNALFDARSGMLSLIDHGLIDRQDPVGSLPRVRSFLGGANARTAAETQVLEIPLSAETVEILERTDREAIKGAFAQLMKDQAGASTVGGYARKQTPAYLDQVLMRLDDITAQRMLRALPMW